MDATYSAVVQSYHIASCVDNLAKESQIPSVPEAYTDTPSIDGVGSAGSSTAWARGDHVHPTDTSRASATDLPYRLVEPGVWEFSDGGTHTVTGPIEDQNEWVYVIDESGYSQFFGTETEALAALSLTFTTSPAITATRASLPSHLCDHAVNAVSINATMAFTIPASTYSSKARDLYVNLDVKDSV